jgi:hypothetical protein
LGDKMNNNVLVVHNLFNLKYSTTEENA